MLWRYLAASRPQFFTASIMPVLVAGAYVKWRDGAVPIGLWALTGLAMVLLHAAANLFNDYFDKLSGADDANIQFVAPFTGGSRFIQRGLLSPPQVLFAALLCIGMGCGIGLYLAATRGAPILYLGVVGAVTLFFYTAPPFRLGYRGLGEALIALDFGVLPMLGTEYVLTRAFTFQMLVASVPLALFITAVLIVNEFPDVEADALVGKRHIVVILGRRAAVSLLVQLYCAALALTALLVAVLWLPAAALGALGAAIPAAIAAQALALAPHDRAAWARACPAGVAAHLLYGLILAFALLASGPLPAS